MHLFFAFHAIHQACFQNAKYFTVFRCFIVAMYNQLCLKAPKYDRNDGYLWKYSSHHHLDDSWQIQSKLVFCQEHSDLFPRSGKNTDRMSLLCHDDVIVDQISFLLQNLYADKSFPPEFYYEQLLEF